MDLGAGAVPGDRAVPDGRRGHRMEVTLGRGSRRVCQSGISDGLKDGRNRGGFLYSDRRSTAEKGAVRCQRGSGCSSNRATGRRPRTWRKGGWEEEGLPKT